MKNLGYYVSKVRKGYHLTYEEAIQAGTLMLECGESALIAGFLNALRNKGETRIETAGILYSRLQQTDVDLWILRDIGVFTTDVCGTGGDGLKTFNISTATAFVLAACGISIAKNCGGSVTSPSGSVNVLESLGVQVCTNHSQIRDSIGQHDLAFFTPSVIVPPLPNPVQKARKMLQGPTIWNVLNPFLSPIAVNRKILGVSRRSYQLLAKDLFKELRINEGAILIGEVDNADEITLCGPTICNVILEGVFAKEMILKAKDFGLAECSTSDLRGANTHEGNADILRRVLCGEISPRRNVVVANAALTLWIGSPTTRTLKECVAEAEQAIDSGKAFDVLCSMQLYSS